MTGSAAQGFHVHLKEAVHPILRVKAVIAGELGVPRCVLDSLLGGRVLLVFRHGENRPNGGDKIIFLSVIEVMVEARVRKTWAWTWRMGVAVDRETLLWFRTSDRSVNPSSRAQRGHLTFTRSILYVETMQL